jgi:shikimate dehydrogenase
MVANRTLDRSEALARELGVGVRALAWDRIGTVAGQAGLVVNTTALGMDQEAELPFDVRPLPGHCIVCDVVYAPLVTKLLDDAGGRGLRTVDGLGMLLHQAVPGFEKWFGVRPQVTAALRQIVVDDLRRH